MSTLKKYLDKEIGDHGYIQILRYDNALLCEGIVCDLRTVPLWELIVERETEVKKAYSSVSQSGRKCTTIVLKKRWNDR